MLYLLLVTNTGCLICPSDIRNFYTPALRVKIGSIQTFLNQSNIVLQKKSNFLSVMNLSVQTISFYLGRLLYAFEHLMHIEISDIVKM